MVLTAKATGADILGLPLIDRPQFFEFCLRPWILEGFEELRNMDDAAHKSVEQLG